MTSQTSKLGEVGEIMQDLLPLVNEGFNWQMVEDRFDKQPVGKAISIHFTGEDGQSIVEEVYIGIAEGPEVVIIPELDDSWEFIGAVVTYQDYGLRILDPDDPMTADRARYQYGGITIQPAESQSRARVWLVSSSILQVMLQTVVYKTREGESGASA